jgi:hypothetical protein
MEFNAGSKLFISLRSYTVEEKAQPLQELNILHIIAGLNNKGSYVCHIIAGLNKKGSHVSHIIAKLNKYNDMFAKGIAGLKKQGSYV